MNIQIGDIIHSPTGGIMVKDFIDNETLFGYEHPWVCCELPFVLKIKDIVEKDGKLTANFRGKSTMFPYKYKEDEARKNS